MAKTGSRFHVRTFGCQMNVNDSEKVAGLLRAEGMVPAAGEQDADFIFINTCAVREKAAEKLFHALGRLKRMKARRPELRIGVGGCVAQLEKDRILERAPHVDILVGTHTFGRVPELLQQARAIGQTAVSLERRTDAFEMPPATVAHSSPVRAYVTVIEGCNHVCSFCVVPRTRGTEVCRPADNVVSEVRSLVERSYREVMLLRQTVNAYQHDGIDFADLLARVDAVPGLERLRFTTSHPEHVTQRMAEALRDLPRVCPYLHLPVQSGSDRILADMRRGYTRAEYLDTVRMLRSRMPDLALTSDVIVGYPGEGEAEFEQTLGLVEEVGYDGLFVFLYSPRPGTTAFRLGDPVPEPEKRRRFQVLNERQQQRQAALNASRVGRVEEVLVDTVSGQGRLAGRTRHFRIVHFDGPPTWVGRTMEVEVTGAGPNALTGKTRAPSLTVAAAVPIL